MDFTTIEGLIIGYAPLVATIITIISSFVVMLRNIKEIKDSNDEEKQSLQNQMKTVLDENYKLKKSINEMLTKIDGIKRG